MRIKTNSIIRLVKEEDADAIARLSNQLGYPTSGAKVKQRLQNIQPLQHHQVYVAEIPDDKIVGWIHIYDCQSVHEDSHAEIGGLVVDENYRGYGIGQKLVQKAEEWAINQGIWTVFVRSNIIRKDAHAFYQKLGYNSIKTQMAFRKVIEQESS